MSVTVSTPHRTDHPVAMLIDCDGTIFPYIELAHEAMACRTMAHMARELGQTSDMSLIKEVWHDTLGKGIRNFFATYMDVHQEKCNENIAALITPETLESHYEAAYIDFASRARLPDATQEQKDFFRVRNGLPELFDWAHQNGIHVIAVSNATQRILETSLSASALKFTDIIGSDTVRAAGYGVKPEPGPYLFATTKHKLDPAQCVGMEDTLSGLHSLHYAGVGTIIRCKNLGIEPREELGIATHKINVHLTVTPESHLFRDYIATMKTAMPRAVTPAPLSLAPLPLAP